MQPPRYYDQDFKAKRWSHQRGFTLFFNFSFPHYTTKTKKCASAGLRQSKCKELKFRIRLCEENLSRAEGSPAYTSYPG